MSSSAPSYDRQRNSTDPESSVAPREDVGDTSDSKLDDRTGTSDGLRYRRHRSQASSSFRIDSPGEINSSPARERSRRAGKRRSDGSDSFAQQSRPSHRHHREKPFLGSSPLGKAVTNASPAEANAQDSNRHASPSSQGADVPSADAVSSGSQPRASFDNDTTQIVNLALNLSESRRRTSSGKFLTSPSRRNRRVTSSNLPHSPVWDTHGQAKPRERSRQFTAQTHRERPTIPSSRLAETPQAHDNDIYDFSDATLARAEKARKHFEFFAEYLRLLPLLPPLRTPIDRRKPIPDQSHESGRAYNPLQYIRNRKVRFRERCAINNEIGGWEDSEKVHNWVETIVTTHENTYNHPNTYVQLPPIDPEQGVENSTAAFSPSSPSGGRPHTGDPNRPRRPRMDWMLSPSSLLADAAWLEQDSNKSKIEGPEGDKVFPLGTEFNVVSLTGVGISPETTPADDQNKQWEQERQQTLPLSKFTSIASQSPQSSSRGRRRHRFAHSLSLTPSHSHSRASSNHRWRKALTGSSSLRSSSTGSDGGWRKKLNDLEVNTLEKQRLLGLGSLQSDEREVQGTTETRQPNRPLQIDTRPERLRRSSQHDDVGRRRSLSQHQDYSQSVASSTVSDSDRAGTPRPSIGDVETVPNSPARSTNFPSIAINLTPSQSRSASPNKGPLAPSQLQGQERGNDGGNGFTPNRHPQDSNVPDFGPVQVDFSPSRRRTTHDNAPESHDFRRIESLPTKLRRGANHQEAKIRGMFKGGRIAELVGNEVSKVGDFIWKRDLPGHSRRSSSASSVLSEYAAANDDVSGGKGKSRLDSSKQLGDELQPPAEDKQDLPKYHVSNSLGGNKERVQPVGPLKLPNLLPYGIRRHGNAATGLQHKTNVLPNSKTSGDGFNNSLKPDERASHVDKDVAQSTSRERHSHGAQGPDTLRRQPSSSKILETTRNWSISSRSITRTSASSRVGKRDIAGVHAQLVSSGTKALQIRRKAEIADGSTTSKGPNELKSHLLHTVASREAVATSRNQVAAFDSRTASLRRCMSTLSCEKVPAMTSSLERLETVISSLNPRMRSMTLETEELTSELSTTSTLAIKQLNDALDKGIRKRNRRFRRLSRLGFVLLEWFLVGAMWLVWTIVMMLKVTRGVWRGTVSGIRWILWL